MADFSLAIPIILKHEGGFVNHPADPGGATNKGITFKLYKKYCFELEMSPTIQGLQYLSDDNAKYIFKKEFWDKMQGDSFKNQQVATIVFDAFVNMGPRALKMLQKQLGVETDGVIGKQTIEAVNFANPKVIFDQFKDARLFFYKRLVDQKPKMAVFLKGWNNRVNSFNYV